MPGIIILIFAVVFLLVGPFLGHVGRSSRRHAVTLSMLNALRVDGMRMGQQGYVEGTISDVNPEAEFGLVAYRRYRYGGERKRRSSDPTSVSGHSIQREPIWTEEEGYRPVLTLDTQAGKVRVGGSYTITFMPSRFVSDEELRKGTSYKLEGFKRGESVVTVGEVASDDEGKLIYASDLAGTDFQTFRKNYKSSGTFAMIAGSVMTLLGLAFTVLGLFLLA